MIISYVKVNLKCVIRNSTFSCRRCYGKAVKALVARLCPRSNAYTVRLVKEDMNENQMCKTLLGNSLQVLLIVMVCCCCCIFNAANIICKINKYIFMHMENRYRVSVVAYAYVHGYIYIYVCVCNSVNQRQISIHTYM